MRTPESATSLPPAPFVLVIDKDHDWRATLFDFLSTHGYQVLCAESLERARRFLADEDPPSVVLLCWDLVTSISEKAELIDRVPRGSALLLMSTDARNARHAEEFNLPFLPKPFELDDFARAVAQSVTRRRRPPRG